MAQEVLFYISSIIVIASVLTVLARIVRQPPIIAYLATGIIVGPLFLKLIGSADTTSELISIFAHLGVAFLLFIVGLSLDLRVLKEIGGVATFVGFVEIAITSTIGFLIAFGLGFSNLTSLYIGAALAFSSTVVIIKILSDKKEIDTLHGRIALGILIIEDFVAAIALMAIPLIQKGENLFYIVNRFAFLILLIAIIFISFIFVFSRLLDYLAKNQEVLFLFGIAWALMLASVFDWLGFSLEIGALIAGMSLASSKYTLELGGKIKPLRDFFIILFFVFFGSQLTGPISSELIKNAVLFSIFVIIGKPIIVMSVLRTFGYKKRTNFLTGSSLAQISEFSLIIILLGFSLGHISQDTMSLVVLIAIFTIGASSYSIYYSHWLFNKLSRVLVLFEGKRYRKLSEKKEQYEIILFGYHRLGYKMLEALKKINSKLLIVDYNPKVILSLAKEGLNCVYGDAGDKDFLSQFDLSKAKLIISTVPGQDSNLTIRDKLKEIHSKAAFIATAEQPRNAVTLYEAGIDYVLIPHHLSGEYASHIISKYAIDRKKYKELGKIHIRELKKGKDNSNYM
ncbi:MAG: cation:proton antiporter family protein [Nanoarchaeota archaeon]